MQIGNITLANPVVLAPMAGVTDSSFRLLAKEMGCALVYSEMISAKGVLCAPKETMKIARFMKDEQPISIQLFGSDPAVLAQGAGVCEQLEPDIIDINMGCPVKKVAGKGEGCALMRDPQLVYTIVSTVRHHTKKPVTVKIRKGWDELNVNATEVALAAQDGGAAAIAVHGRTRAQGYSGKADWSIIGKVRQAVRIPVIGNGDIFSPQDAKQMLEQTGCDAVMIGRGVLGNLWLIRRTVHYLQTGELLPEPVMTDRVALAIRHLELVAEEKGEYIGIREMRKHFAWYIKGIPGAASIRNLIMKAQTKKEMVEILTSLLNNNC